MASFQRTSRCFRRSAWFLLFMPWLSRWNLLFQYFSHFTQMASPIPLLCSWLCQFPFSPISNNWGQLAVDSTVDEVLFQLESVALAKILNLVVPPWYTLLGERAWQFGFHFYLVVKMAPKCRGRNMIAPGRVRHQTGVSSKRGVRVEREENSDSIPIVRLVSPKHSCCSAAVL